ncbi:MAG: hypothetical protein U1F61_21850 [Opitutaceae bacterium]
MKQSLRLLLLGLWFSGATVLVASPSWTADPVLGAKDLETQWAWVNDPSRAVGIRGLFRFALEATGLNWHPERVEHALKRARTMQDLAPGSPTFGNFRWNSSQTGVVDLNAVEFASQLMGFMRRHQSERLSETARSQLDAMMADAIPGLRSHVVKIDYTNIFLMKAWSLIALGETLGRADVAEDGYRRFDAWFEHTARYGIGEYGAVVYYGIDLDSLALLARFAGRAEARAKAEQAIRYLWTDLAANWWKPGDRMGGTNARTYDYLYGRGYTEAHTWTAGWLRERPELEGAGWLGSARENLVTFREAVTWRPPTAWTEAVRAEVPRTVVQQWGMRPEERAVHWIGHHVSLASSGASRSRDERTLVANLGDSPAIPQLTLFMEGRGDPYGLKKLVGGKALHFTPFIASVQRGPEVLQILSDEPLGPGTRNRPGELSSFVSHLTFPATAEVWIGERQIPDTPPERSIPVAAGVPLFVRCGEAVIGVRILLATTTTGEFAPVHWVRDDGVTEARRFTVQHASSEPTGRAHLAVYFQASEGLDAAAFATWRAAFTSIKAEARLVDGRLVAEAAGLRGPLRIKADPVKQVRLEVTGGEPPGLLSVNGRDLGRELLGPVP